MTVTLKVEVDDDLCLWLGPDDIVQVPFDGEERAKCRKALQDALDLMDQTIVKWSTFSTASAMGECVTRNSPHLDGCLAVYNCSPPSKQQADSPTLNLRLVPSDPT